MKILAKHCVIEYKSSCVSGSKMRPSDGPMKRSDALKLVLKKGLTDTLESYASHLS